MHMLLLQVKGVKEKTRKELAAIINAVINAKEDTGKRKWDELLERIEKDMAVTLTKGSQ